MTVVVPTYNAERYLNDNLDSLCIPELMSEIEVLIINDGSTDKSKDIAARYVTNYPHTYRLISKENGGHGSGINCGIQLAEGKYLKIVDADDWVNKETFRKFVYFLKKQDSDIVCSGFLWAYDCGEICKESFQTRAEIKIPFQGVQFEKEYLFDDIASVLYIKMHNMTIKTEILKTNNIIIDENCYYVDTEFTLYPIPYINTICFFKEFVYMYRIHTNGQSIDVHKMQQNKENYERVLYSLFSFYKKLNNTIPCSKAKKQYISQLIARVVAGNLKIILSFPPNKMQKKVLVDFDKSLYHQFPSVYNANINFAIRLLRLTNYRLYFPVSLLVRKKYRA